MASAPSSSLCIFPANAFEFLVTVASPTDSTGTTASSGTSTPWMSPSSSVSSAMPSASSSLVLPPRYALDPSPDGFREIWRSLTNSTSSCGSPSPSVLSSTPCWVVSVPSFITTTSVHFSLSAHSIEGIDPIILDNMASNPYFYYITAIGICLSCIASYPIAVYPAALAVEAWIKDPSISLKSTFMA